MTKEQVLLVVQEAIKKNTDKSELGLAYEQGFEDGANYALQKLEQCSVSGALPPVPKDEQGSKEQNERMRVWFNDRTNLGLDALLSEHMASIDNMLRRQ